MHSTVASGLLFAVAALAVACSTGPDEQPAAPELAAQSPPSATPGTVDPYGTDPIIGSGSREEVCRGGEAANRPGRLNLVRYFQETWPDAEKVLGFECREIWNPGRADCDREVEPVYSDCWSMHATGRAIDVVVGGEQDSPTPAGVALGDRIVTAFLAAANGINHYLARTTGVQEIIWNDRCWYPRDVAVVRAEDMSDCGIPGHDNHIHFTLSNAGADAQTSWHRTR